mgnify:CR=1 FL=1
MSAEIRFRLDGQDVSALPGETILQAAARHGHEIPHLCHREGMRPDGNCRSCVVEITGERALAAACCRRPAEGMEVASASERARRSQRLVLELLQSEVGEHAGGGELARWS